MRKFALILAGGQGVRLWPLSRENYPKQFVEFKDNLSLFQLTLKRICATFILKHIFIIAQENYKFTLYNQIDSLRDIPRKPKEALKQNIILEPSSKNTLPAILLSLKYLEEMHDLKDEDLIHVFPSDHVIEPLVEFKKSIQEAQAVASKHQFVLFGARAPFPKEGYGYILTGQKTGMAESMTQFIEKPSLSKAAKLIKKSAYWNVGIFCFTKRVFLNELKNFQPRMYQLFEKPLRDFIKRFNNLEKISLDYGIMQKTKKAVLLKFRPRWSDLGTWDSFLKFYMKKEGNFSIGQAEFLLSKNCFVYSPQRLACLVGLKGVMAIDTPDSLLLVKKGHADKVRELIAAIKKKGYTQSKEGKTVYRPWGYYTVLHEAKGYKVKEIGIYPKRALSLQKHRFRSEHWNIVFGMAKIFIGRKVIYAKKNESVFVPKNMKHKIINSTKTITKIIEVQIGSYVGEDDIRRFDAY